MTVLWAALPILLLLTLIIVFKFPGTVSSTISFITSVLIAFFFFGLNWQVFSIAMLKTGSLLVFVLLIIWPAMLLFETISVTGGIESLAKALQSTIHDRGFLWILLAWCFSAFLEGIAGFGTPIAIVAPILILLGVAPVPAVIAVAIGHSWVVTFGNMGVVIQTLAGVTNMQLSELVFPSSLLMAFVCIFCGLAVTFVLKQYRQIPLVIVIGLGMGLVQGLLANFDMLTLSGILGAASGILLGLLIKRKKTSGSLSIAERKAFRGVIGVYVGLAILLVVIFWPGPLRTFIQSLAWIPTFPEVMTNQGFVTSAGPGQILRPFGHPGVMVLIVSIVSMLFFRKASLIQPGNIRKILNETWHNTYPASITIITTILLSAIMEHSGMTMTLAKGLSSAFHAYFPIVSPWVGILGSFATGSNNSSNILFAAMQKQIAILLSLAPAWLVAAQTAGGSLGSMISPAKLTLAVTSAGIHGKEGEILKVTLPISLAIGVLIGLLVYFFFV